MKITAFDIVRLLHEVERVSASKIPEAQKTMVLTELRNEVPEPVFCAAATATAVLFWWSVWLWSCCGVLGGHPLR